jgi:LPXTG-motif cell wall-anchored protein
VKRLSLSFGLLGLLLCAPPAQAQLLQGGYDDATRQLEAGFKIVASERIGSDTECYPGPEEIAAVLQREMGIEVVVTPSFNTVQGFGLVNVVADENECNRLVLAIRAGAKGRIFVLDSDYGPVYVQGDRGLSEESLAAGVGPLRGLTAATLDIRMTELDQTTRYDVLCPSGTHPLGGGWFNRTQLGNDGEGLYPHSYERLGVQSGFHVTATYIDPSTGQTQPRRGSIQVLCGEGLVPTASPHETTFVRREGTGTVTAPCPEGTQLFSGGFQRTNFTTPGVVGYGGIMYGGNYITESRADGNAWKVSAGAVDADGGELTAIAYCAEEDRSLPITTVSASASVEDGEIATATTPRCPRGRALIAGGFDTGGSYDALFADGYFTRAGTWSVTGYGWFGSAELTAYGYCAEARDTVDRSVFPKELPTSPVAGESGDDGSSALLYAGAGLLALAVVGLFLRRRQVVRRRARRSEA